MPMRRDLLKLSVATLASSWVAPVSKGREEDPRAAFDFYFLEILKRYLRNGRKTSSSFAVYDFPDGTFWNVSDYEKLEMFESFEESNRRNVNIINPQMAVSTL